MNIEDRYDPCPVVSTETSFKGRVWDVRTDVVDLGDAGEVTRDFIQHTGAVAVLAVRGADGAEQVAMIQQYRHPVGTYCWEIPAGLLDKAGEDPRDAAARELREEVDLDAGRWDVLIDLFTSPGAMSENIRVFFARDVFAAVEDGFDREGEEAGMSLTWVDLDDAVAAVLGGRMHNGPGAAAVLAGHIARQHGWASLRPADAPWPYHPAHR